MVERNGDGMGQDKGAADTLSVAVYLYEPGDGGLDRVAILLANHLRRRGVAVELWLTRTEGPAAHLIDPAVPVRQVPAPPLGRRAAMIAQFPLLAAMVRRHRPDILYSAGNQSNMLVALAALGTGTRAVGRISNPIRHPGKTGVAALARLLRIRAIARISTATIVMGQADRSTLSEAGPLAAPNVRLLPRPTVTPAMERTASARRDGDAAGPRRLLMVGRLTPQKDHATALAALARLTDVDWRLKIAGQGPLRDDLRTLCRALGIERRVEFLGYVADPARLAQLMGEADLLLQSSRWEGLAGTMIEALACGAGVVSTDSTPNIRPLLAAAGQPAPVPAGDAAAFAAAIRAALARPAPGWRLVAATAPHRVEVALDAYLDAFRAWTRPPRPQPALSRPSMTR